MNILTKSKLLNIDKKVSLIISTFNNNEALKLILIALNNQTHKNFEVIIADDGSDTKTAEMITAMQEKVFFKITHVWQEHHGFRVAAIRNKAVAASSGEYLIFLDGDCIPSVNFVNNHLVLAEEHYFVAGNRVLLAPEFTKKIIQQTIAIYNWSPWQWLKSFFKKEINRMLPIMTLSIYPRYLALRKWQGAKTCNLGIWKKDFILVGGFDESYQGWGYEDSDLVVRLIKNHVLRKEGRFAGCPVFHLWHKPNDRVNEQQNYQKFIATL